MSEPLTLGKNVQVWQITGEGTRLVFIESGDDDDEDVDMDE